jgi:hypothetical protein
VSEIAIDEKLALFAVGGYSGDIEIRSVANPDHPGVFVRALSTQIRALAFHPKEAWLAALDQHGNAVIVDAGTGALVGSFEHLGAPDLDWPSHLEFNESGNRLLVLHGTSGRWSTWPEVLNTDPNEWAAIAERTAGLRPSSAPSPAVSKL